MRNTERFLVLGYSPAFLRHNFSIKYIAVSLFFINSSVTQVSECMCLDQLVRNFKIILFVRSDEKQKGECQSARVRESEKRIICVYASKLRQSQRNVCTAGDVKG